MAILTWRNVDAPNFSGALEGYRTASQLLGNAVKSGQDAVGAYTQANSDAADRAIMNRALGLQTAEAHQAALASGALVGPDGQNASMKLLGDMDTRPTTLLNRDVIRENLDQTQYTNQRGREDDAALNAAGPDIALARTLARNNDQETLNKLLQTSPTIQKLRPEQLASLLTGVDTLSTSFQGRRSSDVNFGQGQWRFGNEVRDSNDAQTAQAAWLEIQRDNATPGTVQGAVNARAGTMSPGAMARLNNLAKGGGYNINGPIGVAAPGAGVSSSGSGGAPASDTLMGRFVDGLAKLETGGGSKTVKGPAGEDSFNLFNIKDFSKTGSGFRAKDAAEGSNDRYRTYANPDEAKADLMKLLSTRYPAALQAKNGAEFAKALKDGGYATDPNYIEKLTKVIGDTSDVADKDPAAALTEDVRKRAGMNLGVDLTRQEMRERAGQNQATGIFPELDALQASRKKSVEIADQLIGETGPLRGANRAEVLDYINWIVDNSNGRINPAMAGEMLARNVGSADNAFERAGSAFLDIFGMPFGRKIRTDNLTSGLDGIRLKDEGVYQMMDEYLSGGTSTRRTGQQALAAEDQSLESLRTKYNAADALYREMRVQSKSRPGLAATLPEYQKNRDVLKQALERAVASANSNDTLMPRRDRPTPKSDDWAMPSFGASESPVLKWLGAMGADYSSPEGKKALQSRVVEAKNGGKKLTEVEMLRAKQAGLL